MTWALPSDIAISRATELIAEHTASGEPISTLVSSLREWPEFPPLAANIRTSAFSPYNELVGSLLTVLQAGYDPFWRECQPGGKFEAFYTEFVQARVLPDAVATRWYREFISAMERGQGTAHLARATLEEFTAGIQQAGRDGVAEILVDTAAATARLLAVHHFASLDTPLEKKGDDLQAAIPGLSVFATVRKAELQAEMGGFLRELLDSEEPSHAVLAAEARNVMAALNRETKTAGRCPGPALDGVQEILQLGGKLAPDILWA